MAKNQAPSFVDTPVIGTGQVSVANSNRDGTGTLVELVTGVENGTKTPIIRIQATESTADGMIRLYHEVSGSGNKRLIADIPVADTTVSGTVAAWATNYAMVTDFVLPEGDKLYASTENAETFNIFVVGGDF